LKLADNPCVPLRRSRHAATFLLHSPSGAQDADLFVKYFDPPARWERLKSWFRRARPSRIERVTAALRAAGFSVPPILLHGVHRESRREVVVTARAAGEGPILALRGLRGSIAAKRAVLRALGTEVGRLHCAGFIHGDLTPFNIRIVVDEPPRFAFIDLERTRRNIVIARRRHRLRNLVQLGRFALPGITRSDRMRVFRAYEAALHRCHSRSLEHKAAAMLVRRIERDLDL
jgi:Lipopolysaccharide kinase (Kdo/WaaP) family